MEKSEKRLLNHIIDETVSVVKEDKVFISYSDITRQYHFIATLSPKCNYINVLYYNEDSETINYIKGKSIITKFKFIKLVFNFLSKLNNNYMETFVKKYEYDSALCRYQYYHPGEGWKFCSRRTYFRKKKELYNVRKKHIDSTAWDWDDNSIFQALPF